MLKLVQTTLFHVTFIPHCPVKKIALLIWVSSYNPDATVKPAIAPDLQALVKVLEHENLGGFNHVQ
ncbi:MAG: hypothetical protein ACKO4R_01970, partial [Synechococcales cyanobacterium]